MPFFKSTLNILKRPHEDEIFNINHFDRNDIYLPKTSEWDYNREMQIEDVDIWEVIYEASGGIGIYAAWTPYAEFYLLTTGWKPLLPNQQINDRMCETYYGSGAQQKVMMRANALNIPISTQKIWVDNDQLWLYKDSQSKIYFNTKI